MWFFLLACAAKDVPAVDTGPTDSSATPSTWYADADGDGYGDSATSVDSVAAPSGHVADASDRDDQDATVHPGAEEVCEDGLDTDCDGFDDRCVPEGEVMVDGVGLGFFGTLPGDGAGSSLSMGPDVTGDGRPDILVGVRQQFASSYEGGDPDQFGGAYVVGDFSGPSAELRDVGFRIWGEENRWGGYDNAIVPDMTGDGVAEVVVTAPRYREVCVFHGPITEDRLRSDADACISADQSTATTNPGVAIGVGDQDGDGLTELLTGGYSDAQADDGYWYGVGRALVFSGPLQDGADGDDALAVLRPHPHNYYLGFGRSACTGDLNGDGVADAVVGAFVTTTENPPEIVGGGKFYVMHGPIEGDMLLDDGEGALVAAAGMWRLEHHDAGAGGDVACGGDVNGDGLADVITGAPNIFREGPTTAYLVHGPATGARSLTEADWVLSSPWPGLGGSVTLESDLDGDAHIDPGFSYMREDGVVDTAIFYGGGLAGHAELGSQDITLGVSTPGGGVGPGAGGYDLDGDGYDDLLAGSAYSTAEAEGVGAAWLLFLSPSL